MKNKIDTIEKIKKADLNPIETPRPATAREAAIANTYRRGADAIQRSTGNSPTFPPWVETLRVERKQHCPLKRKLAGRQNSRRKWLNAFCDAWKGECLCRWPRTRLVFHFKAFAPIGSSIRHSRSQLKRLLPKALKSDCRKLSQQVIRVNGVQRLGYWSIAIPKNLHATELKSLVRTVHQLRPG